MKRLKTANKVLIIICVILMAGLVFSLFMKDGSADTSAFGEKTDGGNENLGKLCYSLPSDRFYRIPLDGEAPSFSAAQKTEDIKEGDILIARYRDYNELTEITIRESEKSAKEKIAEFQKKKAEIINRYRKKEGGAALRLTTQKNIPGCITAYISFYTNKKKCSEYESAVMIDRKLYEVTVRSVNGDSLAMGEKVVSTFAKDEKKEYENISEMK